MRVLVVTNTFPSESEPDGTPCVSEQVEKMHEQYGVDFDLLHIDRHRKLNYLKAMWKVLILNFKPNKYDVVHAHYGYSGIVARAQFKYPLIITFHGTDILRARDGVAGRFIAHFVNAIIVMTEEMKIASKRDDAQVIPFGVNTSVFFSYSQDMARSELCLPKEKKLILFPYDPERWEKRFHIVEAVVEKLHSEGSPVQLVTVYGQSREKINKYMNACDVMLLTSDHEGSPMAVREAIVCKLPVVSVDVGDVRSIVDGIEGCYIATEQIDDLAEKVKLSFNHGRLSYDSKFTHCLDTAWSAKKVYDVLCKVTKRSANTKLGCT